jgi:PIN domain nuclease of toxin-antitoxin system
MWIGKLMPEHPIVLDTHVWIWSVTGDPTLAESVRHKIRLCLKKSSVLVPFISVWEVGMLFKKNRLQLKEPLPDWVRSSFKISGFLLAPMTADIALESCLLPGIFHSDPADSIIVATARLSKATLLTRDRRILEYGKAGHIDVLSA